MLAARRFVVSGRVQGVGFRYFVVGAARESGVTGWVRNLPDGRVEVLGEGEALLLDALQRALHEGPPGARVLEISVEVMPPTGAHREFVISR